MRNKEQEIKKGRSSHIGPFSPPPPPPPPWLAASITVVSPCSNCFWKEEKQKKNSSSLPAHQKGKEREKKEKKDHIERTGIADQAISTAGQNNLPFLPTLISKIPSSHAAHNVLPSPLIANPAVLTPISRPVMPPTRILLSTASYPSGNAARRDIVAVALAPVA